MCTYPVGRGAVRISTFTPGAGELDIIEQLTGAATSNAASAVGGSDRGSTTCQVGGLPTSIAKPENRRAPDDGFSRGPERVGLCPCRR